MPRRDNSSQMAFVTTEHICGALLEPKVNDSCPYSTPCHRCVTRAMSRRRSGICRKNSFTSHFDAIILRVGHCARMNWIRAITLSSCNRPMGFSGSKSMPPLTDFAPPADKSWQIRFSPGAPPAFGAKATGDTNRPAKLSISSSGI